MNQAIHNILERAEDYADRKGDPSLRDELKLLEKTTHEEITKLEVELSRCRNLISEMARASQLDSDVILSLRRELDEVRQSNEALRMAARLRRGG